MNNLLKLYDEWMKYSLKDKIETIALLAAVVAAFITVVGAFITYGEYKAQHDLSIASQLRESDRHVSSMILEYPAMDGLWLTVDDSLHGKERANAFITGIINNKTDDIVNKITKWNHISELESILWSDDTLYHDDFLKLRQVYMLAEEILYFISEVFDFEEDGRISEDDVVTYTAYIRDLGSHPLFLHAIWFGHRNGYLTPYVAMRLQEEIMKNNNAVEIAKVIYKELLSPDWPRTMSR